MNQPNNQRSRLQAEEIEAHILLTHSINMLSERIQKTESDFVSHLKKVEDRLDQIVDLTKTVAVLQSQTTQQGDSIVDMRASQREHFQKVDGSVARIHTRIEDAQTHTRDKLELVVKETEMAIKEVSNNSERSIKEISVLASNTDKELKQWLNRGMGAWVLILLVVGSVNTVLWRWVDGIDKDRTQIVQVLEQNKRDHITVDSRLQVLEATSKDSSESLKRLTQSQRDLEDLIYRRNMQK